MEYMKKKYKSLLGVICTIALFLVGCSASGTTTVDTSMTYDLTDKELTNVLDTATIAAMSGTAMETLTQEMHPDSNVVGYTGFPETLAAMEANKADYALVPKTSAILYIREKDYQFEYCSTPIFSYVYAMAISKDNSELKEKINDALQQLKDNGTLDLVRRKWIDDQNYTMDDVPVVDDENAEVLQVALASSTEPLSFIYNNEIVGYDCEVMERIAYILGMKVEFQDMSFAAEIPSLVSGKSDIALSITPTEERKKTIDFTDSYYSEEVVIVSRKTDYVSTKTAFDTLKENFTGTFITENRWMMFVSGICVTLIIAICSYILGTLLGGVLCMMLESKSKVLSKIASTYSKISTGIPVLVWLMILYYIIFKNFNISGIIVAIITFGLQSGASLSGVFKIGIDSIDKGQREAAESLGFSQLEIYKKIIVPQAFSHIYDLYGGQFISLTKSTSIVGYIAISDLTKVSDLVRSRTYQAFFPLITTAIIYFVITHIVVLLLNYAYKKLDPKNRKTLLKGVKMK